MGRAVRACSAIILLAVTGLLAGCNQKPKATRVEAPIAPQQVVVAQPAQPPAAREMPAPTAADVRSALKRVFGDAVNLDESAAPGFAVGDFNSDDSQDVMALVLPNPARMAALNSEVANWTIANPRREWLPPNGVRVFKLPPAGRMREKVTSGERVVAVIHGFGRQGWRSPDARQAYLLREVAGTFAGATHLERLPRQVKAGDVVREKLGAEDGYLYFSGAKYIWQKGAPPTQPKIAAVSGRAAANR
jgi:hypothetical protein